MADCHEITCPVCGHSGSETEFELSDADEAWCPKCGCGFVLEWPDDQEDE